MRVSSEVLSLFRPIVLDITEDTTAARLPSSKFSIVKAVDARPHGCGVKREIIREPNRAQPSARDQNLTADASGSSDCPQPLIRTLLLDLG